MPRIAIVPGDGIGVEVTRQVVKLLGPLGEAAGLPLDLDEWDLGAERYLRTGSAITPRELAELGSYDAIFLGAIGDPRVPDHAHARAILLGLRFALDLYINLRPVRLYDPALSPLRDAAAGIDLVIFRENTEGVYVGMGGNFKKDTPDEVAIEEDVNTRKGVERITRAAFEFAASRGRRRVTLTDKANAMPHAGGLWRRVFADVGAEFPGLTGDAVYADALALDLVRRPAAYDVILAPNLFGDILSDLAAALVGGLGLAPSASLHPGRPGLFEPVHGSAPDLAGTDRANPIAAFLTAGLMLDHLGRPDLAALIEESVSHALLAGRTTPDLGGAMGTEAVGDWIVADVLDVLAAAPQRGSGPDRPGY
jgi:3-isopropylmalate dehydrogenase